MKSTFISILLAMLPITNSFAQDDPDDSQSLNVNIELLGADPVCTLGGTQNLNYGNLETPSSGTGTASFDPTENNGNFSYEDGSGNSLLSSGTPTIGTMTLTGTNITEFVISFTWPTYLQRTGCGGESFDADGSCQIPYSGERAWSTPESGGIWYQNHQFIFYTGSVTVYLQFGGEISIPAETPGGNYERELVVEVICE